MPHKITNEELVNYAQGELSDERRNNIEVFLKTNAKARHFVNQYKKVLEISKSDDMVSASIESRQQAKDLWQKQPQEKQNWLSIVDAFVAELIFDSRVQPATVRGSAGSNEFEFHTDKYNVDIRLEQSPVDEGELWVLTGQIEFHDEQKQSVCVSVRQSESGEEVVQALSDDSGFFTIQGVRDNLEVLLCIDDQWTHLKGINFT